jgi:hypothetical protein
MVVVDPHDWLEKNGTLPADLRQRRRVLRIVRLIEYGGPLPPLETRQTLVECTTREEQGGCPGLLWVSKTQDDELYAHCPLCRSDEVLILNWQDTEWADGPMPSMPVDIVDGDSGERQDLH